MSYGLIYTIPFATLDNTPCVVEIEKEGYIGEATELTGAASPFTVDIDDEEFLYTPTRFSTATIRIVGSDYLQSLFSTTYQMYRVTFKQDNYVVWCGFIKPELYTQDYSSETFELELECMSAMSTLEFIDYKQIGENRSFVSLWDLLKKCVQSANGRYEMLYVPHVYGPDEQEYLSENNVLQEMTISEQNFFDEDDKPMKLKEVLEEICKFLNWSCTDWRGELYFVDVDHIGKFRGYDLASFNWHGDSVTPFVKTIQNIDFMGSGHSLDILSGYNKVTVKCSNYCFNNVIAEEEFKKLESFTERKNYNYNQYNETRQYLKSRIFEMPHYENNPANTPNVDLVDEKVTNVFIDEPTRWFLGGYCAKVCEYEINDGKPNISDWNWNYIYQFKIGSDYTYSYPSTVPPTGDELEDPDWRPPTITEGKHIYTGVTLLRYKNHQPIKYYSGAFGIVMSYGQPTDASNMTSCSKLGEGAVAYGPKVTCRLSVADYYYTENGWIKSSSKPKNLDLTFDIRFDYKNIKGWVRNANTKTLNMPYDHLEGYVIEIPDNIKLFGTLEFEIVQGLMIPPALPQYGFFLKDIKIDFKKRETGDEIEEDSNSDRIYENILNENYIKELDEIELKISSYNNDGTCYSKILMGEDYLSDNLYSTIENKTVRPEEQLIRRIIKRYSAPRIKLTQVIKETAALTPITRLSDNYMVNKKFINAGGTIDYKMNQFQCIMIEI